MSTLSVTNTFVNGNNADASQVNADFNDVVTYVNSNAIVKDGSLAFTNNVSQSATPPTAAAHLSRKDYVDRYSTKTQIASGAYDDASPWNAAGQKVYHVDITDPGYDIKVWVVGQVIVAPLTASDLGNIWELRTTTELSTGVGTFSADTDWSGLRIPIVTSQQSLCSPSYVRTFTTGAGFGTNGVIRVRLNVYRTAGTQATLTAFTPDSRYAFLQVWWTGN